jgi:dolichol-phosphate mannosyltransferase
MRGKEPQLSVIIPTRDEADNIPPLLNALRLALRGIRAELIVVDDSDDETPQIVERLAAAPTNDSIRVRLVHRPPGPDRAGGLATAASMGMEQATGTYLAVIDADLQHPPERLRALFDEAVDRDADVVMATRYRAGGSHDGLDGISRRLISLGLKWVAKIVFPDQLLRVSDPLGGFFLVRRSIVEGVTLRPIGYKISLELLVRCRWARLVEVPYHFQARVAGQSKSDFKQGLLVLRHMGRLVREVPAAARFWKFALVGASGVVVNFALFLLLTQMLHLHQWLGWVVATEVSVLSNFTINYFLTWRDVTTHTAADWERRAVMYHGAVAPGIALNFAVFGVASTIYHQAPVTAQILGVTANILLSYWLARRVVFAPRESWSSLFRSHQPAMELPDGIQESLAPEADPAPSVTDLSGASPESAV